MGPAFPVALPMAHSDARIRPSPAARRQRRNGELEHALAKPVHAMSWTHSPLVEPLRHAMSSGASDLAGSLCIAPLKPEMPPREKSVWIYESTIVRRD